MAARRRAALAYNTDDFAVSINRMQSLSRFAIQVPSTSRFEMKPPTLEATKFEYALKSAFS